MAKIRFERKQNGSKRKRYKSETMTQVCSQPRMPTQNANAFWTPVVAALPRAEPILPLPGVKRANKCVVTEANATTTAADR